MKEYWFKSSKFEIVPDEDKETNPRRFGKSLANWFQSRLSALGYSAEVIPEDWGWCVVCSRDPFLLWVGCVSVDDQTEYNENDPVPEAEDIIWNCFAVAEVPFFKKLFNKINTQSSLEKLNSELYKILNSETAIEMTEEP